MHEDIKEVTRWLTLSANVLWRLFFCRSSFGRTRPCLSAGCGLFYYWSRFNVRLNSYAAGEQDPHIPFVYNKHTHARARTHILYIHARTVAPTHAHTHTHTHTHADMHTYTNRHAHTHTHMQTHPGADPRTHAWMHVPPTEGVFMQTVGHPGIHEECSQCNAVQPAAVQHRSARRKKALGTSKSALLC
jgi:hypothetical protein